MVYIAQLTLMRVAAGEPTALAEYAAEIRKSDPYKDQPHTLDAFEPMWTYPDDPDVREAVRWLFNDPGSPWRAFLRNRNLGSYGRRSFITTNLYASPLLMSAGFREAVLAALAIKSEWGTVRRTGQTEIRYEQNEGINGGVSASEADLEGVAQGVDQSVRACDYIAWQISAIEAHPGASCTG